MGLINDAELFRMFCDQGQTSVTKFLFFTYFTPIGISAAFVDKHYNKKSSSTTFFSR